MKTLALTAAAATILAFGSAAQAAPYANCYLHIAGNPNIPCPPVHTVMVVPSVHYRHVPAHVVTHQREPMVTGSIALNQPHFAPARRPAVTMVERRSECRRGEYFAMNEPGGSGDTTTLMRCPA
jgi:hypothetical protein